MTSDADLHEVIRRERALLDPAVRADRGLVDALLDAQFVEFGASGTVWQRQATLDALAADSTVPANAAHGFEAHRLADGVILLTFRLEGERPSLRSSIWVRADDGMWRMRFHQGTLTAR